MAKINSLVDNSNEVVYPQTRSTAVIMSDGTTAEASIASRPKLILSSEDPAETIDDNTLYGVYGELGQITADDIADSAVQTGKIANSAVTTDKVSNGAITTAKLASEAVTTSQLGGSAVTTAKISDSAVTNAKIAASTITAAKCDWSTFLDKIYPVGSIYMTVSHTSTSAVATALGGGTWVAWGTGRVPVGVDTSQTEFNTVSKTGGSKYLQNHNHDLRWASSTGKRVMMSYNSGSTAAYNLDWSSVNANVVNDNIMTSQPKDPTANTALTTGTSGNLQPYITVYMWKRTA